MDIAYSPCPNDTFIFHAWAHKLIDSPIKIEPTLLDIDQLNHAAISSKFSITKLSTFCLGLVTDSYRLLESGAAIVTNTGPKLVAKRSIDNIKDLHIAVPGLETTANLLLHLTLDKPKKISVIPYHKIISSVVDGVCDAGVVIHESRFSFDRLKKEHEILEVFDLGELFYKLYSCPIPLGVIVAKRELNHQPINKAIRDSISFARSKPDESLSYILNHSQEKDIASIKQHIDLYVNDESLSISEKGYRAINLLFEKAIELDLLPKKSLKYL